MVSAEMLVEVKDRFRRRLSKYTRKAFSLLPKLEKPRILDVGCGSGVPTMELAKLSSCVIVGVDVDQKLLDMLSRKAAEAGVSNRVETVNTYFTFDDKFFSVFWSCSFKVDQLYFWNRNMFTQT